jgi:hypothetical protein
VAPTASDSQRPLGLALLVLAAAQLMVVLDSSTTGFPAKLSE